MTPENKKPKEELNDAAKKGGVLKQLEEERGRSFEFSRGKNPRSFQFKK